MPGRPAMMRVVTVTDAEAEQDLPWVRLSDLVSSLGDVVERVGLSVVPFEAGGIAVMSSPPG